MSSALSLSGRIMESSSGLSPATVISNNSQVLFYRQPFNFFMVDDVWRPAEIQDYCILCRIYWSHQHRRMGLCPLLSCTADTPDAFCPARRSSHEEECNNSGLPVHGPGCTRSSRVSYRSHRVWYPARPYRRL